MKNPIRAHAARGALVILGIAPMACGAPSTGTADPELRPAGQDFPLQDTDWILTELGGAPPLGGAHLTLVVDDSTAGGSSGCNLWGGEATVTATTLAIEMLHMTARACEDPRLMDQETDYLRILAGESRWDVEGDLLTLRSGSGVTLAFRAAGR